MRKSRPSGVWQQLAFRLLLAAVLAVAKPKKLENSSDVSLVGNGLDMKQQIEVLTVPG